jgi:hypothetical protein
MAEVQYERGYGYRACGPFYQWQRGGEDIFRPLLWPWKDGLPGHVVGMVVIIDTWSSAISLRFLSTDADL